MNVAKSVGVFIAVIAIAAASAFVGYTWSKENSPAGSSQKSESDESKEGKETVAKVKVAQARNGVIEQTVAAFGTVLASPEDVQMVSVPFECRVRRVHAIAGQAVKSDTRIIDVEPSPDALLSLSDALSAVQAAKRDLALVQQRLELKLVTKSELSAAEQTLQVAQSKLSGLEKRGIEPKQLQAGAAGLVSKVDAQEGQIIPAGGTLVEVVPSNRIQVKLGVEPSQAPALKPGQVVRLETVQGDHPVKADGELKMITQRVNPTSRLVDVFVVLPAGSPLMLEAFVRGRIVVNSKQALVVPRRAVLPEEDKHVLFTVADGKALEHEVEVGLDDGQNVELLGGDVKPGDAVVVEGNAELEKGMAVEVEDSHESATQSEAASKSAASGEGS